MYARGGKERRAKLYRPSFLVLYFPYDRIYSSPFSILAFRAASASMSPSVVLAAWF